MGLVLCPRDVLLGKSLFYEWRHKGAAMPEMLDFTTLRGADYLVQGRLVV